jgi:hypothetical protein
MAAVVAGPTSILRLARGLLTIKGRQGENRGQRTVARPQHPPLRGLLVHRNSVPSTQIQRLIRVCDCGCLQENLQEISRKN